MAKSIARPPADTRGRERRTAQTESGAKCAPKSGADVRALAREAAVAALRRLAELANSEDERVALAASQELLNRAFGKTPSAAADDQGGVGRPPVIKIIRFGAEEAVGPRAERRQESGRKP